MEKKVKLERRMSMQATEARLSDRKIKMAEKKAEKQDVKDMEIKDLKSQLLSEKDKEISDILDSLEQGMSRVMAEMTQSSRVPTQTADKRKPCFQHLRH